MTAVIVMTWLMWILWKMLYQRKKLLLIHKICVQLWPILAMNRL